MSATPEETAAALEASIEKWKRNAVATMPDNYLTTTEDCPLCTLFNGHDIPFDDSCVGCPVFARTQYRFCVDTPYIVAAHARGRWERVRSGKSEARDAAHAAALAEVAFLESLRKAP